MPATERFSFTRYLAAKRSVDDRALNRPVWDALRAALPRGAPLRVLEAGAGIGTMVERLVEWGLFAPPAGGELAVQLTAIDVDAANIAELRRRLPRWAVERGMGVATSNDALLLNTPGLRLTVEPRCADLLSFDAEPFDLIVGQALLDLLDVPAALRRLRGLAAPGGLLYVPITFDGETIFEPPLDPALDAQVVALYHRTMDERRVDGAASGGARSGRRLYHQCRAAGLDVLAFGASDWLVFPGPTGYTADEAYFLRHILHFVETALTPHPELPAARLAGWLRERRAQVERAELVYIAHQLDLLARAPAP